MNRKFECIEDGIGMIRSSVLFSGIEEQEMKQLLSCLKARLVHYDKGECIYREGACVSDIGVVLDGAVHVIQWDYRGEGNLVAEIRPGQMFAETFACLGKEPLSVSVESVKESAVMFLNAERLTRVCRIACKFHTQVIQNLLLVMAQKNLELAEKMTHMSRHSIREKLLSYFSEQARSAKSPYFTIPFNRQQLAGYLGTERSALSRELGKMREEGLVEFERNQFKLLVPYELKK